MASTLIEHRETRGAEWLWRRRERDISGVFAAQDR